jgi:hypothetical protein
MFFVLSRAVLIGFVLGLVFFQRVQAQEGRKKEAEIYELGEIVVSARKPAIERTSNIVRLTSENIKDFGAKNAAEALSYATGALPTTGRRNQADILIRGIKQIYITKCNRKKIRYLKTIDYDK